MLNKVWEPEMAISLWFLSYNVILSDVKYAFRFVVRNLAAAARGEKKVNFSFPNIVVPCLPNIPAKF